MSTLNKITYDVFPQLNSKLFGKFSCAIMHVYTRTARDLAFDKIIEETVVTEGWEIVSVIHETHIHEKNNRDIAKEVNRHGVVIHFERVAIEQIFLGDSNGKEDGIIIPNELKHFLQNIEVHEYMLHSLYSDAHGQYANGISPNGEKFLPMWTSEKRATNWMCDFPEYFPVSISAENYEQSMAKALLESNMLIAVEASKSQLVTAHPILVPHYMQIQANGSKP